MFLFQGREEKTQAFITLLFVPHASFQMCANESEIHILEKRLHLRN